MQMLTRIVSVKISEEQDLSLLPLYDVIIVLPSTARKSLLPLSDIHTGIAEPLAKL